MATISQTGPRNYLAALKRVIDSCWYGVTNNSEQAPLALNNESILAVNAAGTGTVSLIKANASNITELTNANGVLFSAGAVIETVPSVESATVQSSASATGITLTAANLLNQIFDRTNAGSSQTDTTPTAALLVAAVPGVQANTSIYWSYRNRSANTVTLGAGTGVTLATGNTNTIATVNTRAFLVVFTAVGAGSEAVSIYSLGSSAH